MMDTHGIAMRMEAAKQVAKEAGALLVAGPQQGMQAKSKGKSDFVTVMDLASEQLIKSYLHERFPEDNFLGEETGFEAYGSGGTWVIDPIDGTTNYIYGLPTYTISIAYELKHHEPVLGVVYVPLLGQLFHAITGAGAFLGDTSIHCSTLSDPADSLAIVSPPMRLMERLPQFMDVFGHLCRTVGEMRDFGSAAYHMCLVGAGMAEAFVEFGLKYHDIAAGTVILGEAGGRVSPIDADTPDWSGSIIATNAPLHGWYVSTIRS